MKRRIRPGYRQQKEIEPSSQRDPCCCTTKRISPSLLLWLMGLTCAGATTALTANGAATTTMPQPRKHRLRGLQEQPQQKEKTPAAATSILFLNKCLQAIDKYSIKGDDPDFSPLAFCRELHISSTTAATTTTATSSFFAFPNKFDVPTGSGPSRADVPPNSSTTTRSSSSPTKDKNGFATFHDQNSWLALIMAIVCVLGAALASGLTIGMMSIEPLELEIKQRVGTKEERHHAKALLPVLHRRHLLLVTLLLFNAFAAEALPIFLDELVPSYCSVALSVTMVLIFGEVLPAAIFSGPNQMKLGAQLTPFVWTLIMLFFPLSCPISWGLDWLLGDEHSQSKRYSRAELSALVEIHQRKEEREDPKLHRAAAMRCAPGIGQAAAPPSSTSAGITTTTTATADANDAAHAIVTATAAARRRTTTTTHRKTNTTAAATTPTTGPTLAAGLDEGEPDYHVLQTRKRSDSSGLLVSTSNLTAPHCECNDCPRCSREKKGGQARKPREEGDSNPPSRQTSPVRENKKNQAVAPKSNSSSNNSSNNSSESSDRSTKKRHSPNKKEKKHTKATTEHKAAATTLLTKREVDMTLGVLGLASKHVGQYYQPWGKVFSCSADLPLDEKNLEIIRGAGYSRIPVCREKDKKPKAGVLHDPQYVCGFVLTKHLITVDPKAGQSVGQVGGLRLPVLVAPTCSLTDLLSTFQLGRSHLALVSKNPEEALERMMEGRPLVGLVAPLGIITLEDVIEALLQTSIYDEKDFHAEELREGKKEEAQQQPKEIVASAVETEGAE